MTNHAYLNLGGAVADHVLQLNAAQYLLPDAQGIPVGAPRPVEGTAFDFRTPKRIGVALDGVDPQIEARGGFDHALCLDGEGMREVGGLSLPGGVSLTLWTDQPVTMFYTGNGLGAGTSKAEAPLRARAGLCLEPQAYVDAINRPDFPFNLTTPDHPHLSRIAWKFGR
jgi:aldose 1-epimerase